MMPTMEAKPSVVPVPHAKTQTLTSCIFKMGEELEPESIVDIIQFI